MTRPVKLLHLFVIRLLLCSTVVALLSACDANSSFDCTIHSWLTDKYQVHYRIADNEEVRTLKTQPLSARVLAKAPRYTMMPANKNVAPCDDLAIRKELVLQRQNDSRFVFTEINKYYDARWRRIAKNTQVISEQLESSGHYIATDTLPIPSGAPAGKYYIVSQLLLTREGSKRKFLLAKASTSFRITKPKE